MPSDAALEMLLPAQWSFLLRNILMKKINPLRAITAGWLSESEFEFRVNSCSGNRHESVAHWAVGAEHQICGTWEDRVLENALSRRH